MSYLWHSEWDLQLWLIVPYHSIVASQSAPFIIEHYGGCPFLQLQNMRWEEVKFPLVIQPGVLQCGHTCNHMLKTDYLGKQLSSISLVQIIARDRIGFLNSILLLHLRWGKNVALVLFLQILWSPSRSCYALCWVLTAGFAACMTY